MQKPLGALVLAPLVLALLVLAPVRAEDDAIDNPDYAAWAKWKPGSWVKTTSTFETKGAAANGKLLHEVRLELEKLTKEKAHLAVESYDVTNGQRIRTAEAGRDVPARVHAPVFPGGKAPKTRVQESDEELTIAGKKIKTHAVDTLYEESKLRRKVWTSSEVPGGVVQTEVETVTGADKSMEIATVVEWHAAP